MTTSIKIKNPANQFISCDGGDNLFSEFALVSAWLIVIAGYVHKHDQFQI